MSKKSLLVILCAFLFASVNAQNGMQIFDNRFVHDIKLTTPYSGLYDTLEAHYSTATFEATYIMCTVEIDGVTIDSIGLKQKGASSNFMPGLVNSVKMPLKIDFGNYVKSQLYDGVNKINLSNEYYDPSLMHNAIVYKALNDAGVAAPRTSYARVYLNGVYWGLYTIIEQVDKKFLDNHFPDHNGNLYKSANAQSALDWLGTSRAAYSENYEQQLKNAGDTSYSDLIRLCNIVNNSGPDFYDSITSYLDMESFLKCMAIDYIFKNSDGLVTGGHNFYIYHSTTDDKFYWIPWDANQTFDYANYEILDPAGNSKPVFYNSMQDPAFRDQYFQYICDISGNVVTPANMHGFIDSTYNLIRNDFVADTNKLYSLIAFDNVIDYNTLFSPIGVGNFRVSLGIKPLINTAYDSCYADLLANGFTCTFTTASTELPLNEFAVYPNPFTDHVTIQNVTSDENSEIIIFDIASRKLLQQAFSRSLTINTEKFSPGIYFYRIQN